jgi:hypothetical protein
LGINNFEKQELISSFKPELGRKLCGYSWADMSACEFKMRIPKDIPTNGTDSWFFQ